MFNEVDFTVAIGDIQKLKKNKKFEKINQTKNKIRKEKIKQK